MKLSSRVAAAVAVVVTGAGLVQATPASADPDISTVQHRVDTLYQQAEQASERLNDAKIRLKQLRSETNRMRSEARKQKSGLETLRRQLRDSLLREYQAGASLDQFGQLVTSNDPSGFLANLGSQAAFDDLGASAYDQFATQSDSLSLRLSATQSRAAQMASIKAGLATDKATIDEKLAEANQQLDSLKAQERSQLLSRSDVRVPADVPASGRAAVAVRFALAQVGKAYVYGAAGPNAFDCSGLTMAAWGAAGVALPHSSSAQFGSGPHIAESDLQPGDLVFYYSPISHVGMYIGNGMIVDAGNPAAGVRIAPLHMMPYVGAVRPG